MHVFKLGVRIPKKVSTKKNLKFLIDLILIIAEFL